MMTAAAMLGKNKKPSEETIKSEMSNNLCRCGTYHRIKEAINIAIEEINK
jgi:isoquinoline 1-oxidoreductase subunit alpha